MTQADWRLTTTGYAIVALVACVGPSRRAFFASCGDNTECQSNLCWQGLCSAACTTHDQCGNFGQCTEKHCVPRPSGLAADAAASADAAPGDAPARVVAGAKLVFVTSKIFTAALGGLAGADGNCQALATAAQRNGTFKAWLSDATASPVTRFSAGCKAGGPFVLVDGTVIAKDWAGLTSGSLLKPLVLTEFGTPPPTGNACQNHKTLAVWTGTLNTGEVDPSRVALSCAGWTSASATLKASAMWGLPTQPAGWSFSNTCFLGGFAICSRGAALYCVEQ